MESKLPFHNFRGRVAPMRIRQRIILLSLLALSTVLSQAWAGEPIQLGPEFSTQPIETQVDSWLGPDNRDPKELLTAKPERTGNLRFGYVTDIIWLRFSVANTDARARTLLLRVAPEITDSIDLTQFDQAGQLIQSASFNVNRMSPLAQGITRALPRRTPTFSFETSAKSTSTIVLKVQSRHSMDMEMKLSTPEVEEAAHLKAQTTFGFYYGMFFAIFLFSLLLFLATREKLYLDYIFFLISYIFELSCSNGILSFHFGQYFDFSRYLGIAASMPLVFGILFSRRFLETKRIAPRLDHILLSLVGVGSILALINATPLYVSISIPYGYFIRFCIDAAIITIIAATLVTFRKGHRPAIFFLIAWGTFLILPIIYFAGHLGVIQNSNIPHNLTQLVTSFEMVFLSIATGHRVYALKEDKLAAEKDAEKQSEDSSALRSLIHIICHDLRNPLTVMAGHAEMQLRRGKAEWTPVARAAQTQKEILDYVQIKEAIESGKQSLSLVPVSLLESVENARFLFDERMKEKNIRWDAQIEGNPIVLADPTLLTYTVISNLISNAIKFTGNNGLIEVRSRVCGSDIELHVRDTGIGIPQDLIMHLFSKGVSTTRPGTDGEKGTGFGMPLVKTIMEFFGGSIAVQSFVGDGPRDGMTNSSSGTSMILRLKQAP
jgi:two-component system, sensor histidine kinase LadS